MQSCTKPLIYCRSGNLTSLYTCCSEVDGGMGYTWFILLFHLSGCPFVTFCGVWMTTQIVLIILVWLQMSQDLDQNNSTLYPGPVMDALVSVYLGCPNKNPLKRAIARYSETCIQRSIDCVVFPDKWSFLTGLTNRILSERSQGYYEAMCIWWDYPGLIRQVPLHWCSCGLIENLWNLSKKTTSQDGLKWEVVSHKW